MRKITVALLALLTLCLPALADTDPLPFGVMLGDQAAARVEDNSNVARIPNPVASDVVMKVKDVKGQIIVNIFPSDDKGEVASSAQALILLFDAGASKAISANMQGTTPKSGWYVANVVGEGKTSRIHFQVK